MKPGQGSTILKCKVRVKMKGFWRQIRECRRLPTLHLAPSSDRRFASRNERIHCTFPVVNAKGRNRAALPGSTFPVSWQNCSFLPSTFTTGNDNKFYLFNRQIGLGMLIPVFLSFAPATRNSPEDPDFRSLLRDVEKNRNPPPYRNL